MNARAAAANPPLAAQWHQGDAVPAPFPGLSGPDSAPPVPSDMAPPPTAGRNVQPASGEAVTTRRPVAWPEPEPYEDLVPDGRPATLGEPPDLADLAEHLNQILRDEAHRHGIDV